MRILPIIISLSLSPQAFASDWLELNNLPNSTEYPTWVQSAYSDVDVLSRSTSDLHINLSDWIAEQNLYVTKPSKIVVFADTIEVPENFNLVVNNQNILIFARKIVGQGAPTFVLGQQGAAASVTVIAGEIETPINVLAFQNDGSITRDALSAEDGDGTSVVLAGEHYRRTTIDSNITGQMKLATTPFTDIVNRSFDMAASLFDTNPELSLELINWIEQSLRHAGSVVEDDPILSDLYLQTVAFKQFISFSTKESNYVPYLDKVLYQGKYEAYLNAMIAYQAQWDIIQDRSTVIEDKIEAAKLALDNIEDVLRAQDSIITQTQSNIDKIGDSLTEIDSQYKAQELVTLSARTTYLVGVENWKTQQELNAALAIFKAIAEIGSAVSGVFTGNLSGVNDLTEQLAKTPEALDKAKNLVTNIKTVTGIIDSVTKTISGIAQLTADVKSTIKLHKISEAMDGFDFNIPTLNESNLAWDLMITEIRSNLRLADSLGIKGARQYLVELEKQVLLGKAINTTQLNFAQEQAKLVDLLLTKNVTANQQQRLSDAIESYQVDSEGFDSIERELSRVLMHFKRPMYVALSNYVQAYEYWALKPSEITPSLNKSYLDYQFDLASIENEYVNALSSFQPAPQDFTIDNYTISSPEQLDSFATTGELNFTIPLGQAQLCSFDRVRLSTVRVFLEGENLPYGKQFNLGISSSGNYADRYQDQDYQFSSNPVARAFYYRLDDPTTNDVSIITDGAVANRFEYAYFQPTPFSTWNVTLNNYDEADQANNQYLKDVEQIRVEFLGSGIPNGNSCSN
ncbi:hypothetical protein CWO27_04760 [Vibrio sp. 10N.286.51.C3]|uniref:hypothetical protein n=1 Tax=unclassified Vibrio TaxID=2614977 RepID=UPI000D3564EC|nr:MULTISPECIES: hypothetical protein [unclassified Vibrio]PTP16296.1 hypothetical protein CWO27_04760 [Vibrio sp. 10N.286.51.C3]TKE73125.1 hypothetical protein FCV45_05425 [Vibrio sp. F12]